MSRFVVVESLTFEASVSLTFEVSEPLASELAVLLALLAALFPRVLLSQTQET